MQLSKSEYMMYLKHPAWVWLKKHKKSMLPPPDANLQAMFDQGNIFEDYAEKLFPDAINLGFNNYQEYLSLPTRTTSALADGAKTIFQGRFETGKITCITDVLQRVEGDTFDLHEIKASTKVKPEHIPDLAFQTITLEGTGLNIRNIYVTHVNTDYVRDGDIETEEITETEDVTEKVRDVIEITKEKIKKAIEVAESSTMPDISPRYASMGGLKEWMEIYQNIEGEVEPYSIYNLFRVSATRVGELEDMEVRMLKDIPEDYKLPPQQLRQVTATATNERNVDEEKIEEFLGGFEFPLYFLDYETLSGVIPAFDGIHPYQQVPFQYSLHRLDTPDGDLVHTEYLHTENTHPGQPLIKHLRDDIGEKGTILVWNEGFEKKCNVGLAEMFPKDKEFLEDLNNRIKDLMLPFSQGWLVDKDFFGSASIKKVLPVLVPSLSYKDLTVQEGATAAREWMDIVLRGKNAEGKEEFMKNLVKYCNLDTLAMVEIWKVLRTDMSAPQKEQGSKNTHDTDTTHTINMFG